MTMESQGIVPGPSAADEADEDSWVIECADPEVGIFGDSIVHACDANVEDAEDATPEVAMRDSADGTMVECTTTFTCPRCGATYVVVDCWPAEMFTEPGR